MIKAEKMKDMIKEMEREAIEIKKMRKEDKIHNILVYGYKAIIKINE